MKEMASLVREGTDLLVLYHNDHPVAHVRFEDYGPNRCGANLNWIDSDFMRHTIHFVGTTQEGFVSKVTPDWLLAKIEESESR